jgi:AraC family transcriptional regulator
MTFHPRMKSNLKGISVLSEQHRSWNGVVADVWQVRCENAEGEYESPDPRLFVALQLDGNGSFLLDVPEEQRVSSPSISYVPAGQFLRSHSRGVAYVRHLDLHFHVATLRRQFGASLDERRLEELRLVFEDEQILALCRLIAEECMSPAPLHSLYGDGLTIALIAKLFNVTEVKARLRPRLSEQQLRIATEFMQDNFQAPIRLIDLAELTGLPQSSFSRAFKETTGMSVHRWHQSIRIARAQELLLDGTWPLTQVATATGFADQAHLTRIFKRLTGVTPAYWARRHGRSSK